MYAAHSGRGTGQVHGGRMSPPAAWSVWYGTQPCVRHRQAACLQAAISRHAQTTRSCASAARSGGCHTFGKCDQKAPTTCFGRCAAVPVNSFGTPHSTILFFCSETRTVGAIRLPGSSLDSACAVDAEAEINAIAVMLYFSRIFRYFAIFLQFD